MERFERDRGERFDSLSKNAIYDVIWSKCPDPSSLGEQEREAFAARC